MTEAAVIEWAPAESETIRRAELSDLGAILALEESGFDPASRWSTDSWAAELTGADRCVLVADHRLSLSKPAPPPDTGLLGAATFQLVGDTADLHRVVVAPAHRGRGIGRALVEAGIAWASERYTGRMLLEVEHDNAPALALYRGLGFTELARRKDYYGAGRHALVMQYAIAMKGDIAVKGDVAVRDDIAGLGS